MRSFVTGACVMTTYPDEADGRRHDGLVVGSPTPVPLDPPPVSAGPGHHSAFLADPLKTKALTLSILDVGATDTAGFAKTRDARTTALRTVSATPGRRSVATGQPSLITTRCKEHT
jgi:hypothetical protein